MRKLFALAVVVVALTGDVAFVSLQKPNPAVACIGSGC
jgi:hypothetical protein